MQAEDITGLSQNETRTLTFNVDSIATGRTVVSAVLKIVDRTTGLAVITKTVTTSVTTDGYVVDSAPGDTAVVYFILSVANLTSLNPMRDRYLYSVRLTLDNSDVVYLIKNGRLRVRPNAIN